MAGVDQQRLFESSCAHTLAGTLFCLRFDGTLLATLLRTVTEREVPRRFPLYKVKNPLTVGKDSQ